MTRIGTAAAKIKANYKGAKAMLMRLDETAQKPMSLFDRKDQKSWFMLSFLGCFLEVDPLQVSVNGQNIEVKLSLRRIGRDLNKA